MFILSIEIFFWSNKSLILPLFLFEHPCKWLYKCVVSYCLIALSLLLQWLQIAHGIPFMVFFSKSLTTEVNLCFLLDWVALVRSMIEVLGGQGVRIEFSTWLDIAHPWGRERNCFLLTEKHTQTNLLLKPLFLCK